MKEDYEKVYENVKEHFKKHNAMYSDEKELPKSYLVIAYLSGYRSNMPVSVAYDIMHRLIEEGVVDW